jgi:hypothetical protein
MALPDAREEILCSIARAAAERRETDVATRLLAAAYCAGGGGDHTSITLAQLSSEAFRKNVAVFLGDLQASS